MAMPKTSAEIVAELGANPSSPAKRQASLNKILTDNRHDTRLASTKVAQGVVGPIIMRLRYEGIVRSVLMEDPLPQGAGLFYDITTEFGAAYKLQPHDNEVKISQYEGNRVRYEVIRIAAFPQISEEDIYKLAINMVDYAKGEAEQRIMEQEDGYLFSSLDAAVAKIDTDNPDWAGLTSHVSTVTGEINPKAFYDAEKIAIQNRLQSHRVIMNPATANDLYTWKIDTTGVKFLDDVMDGKPITKMGKFSIMTSIICPLNKIYLVPEPEYLGWMPILKQLEGVDNPKAENFTIGWVYSELVNEIIANSYGIVRMDLTA
jgi:hypothetical protein